MENAEIITRVMKLAAGEAGSSHMAEVMPVHLLIALSRLSEDDASSDGHAFAAALRQEFESFGIEPRKFRRRLRGLVAVLGGHAASESLRPSESSEWALALAEALSRGSDDTPYPAHLLRAVLLCLADLHTHEPGSPLGRHENAVDEIPHEL